MFGKLSSILGFGALALVAQGASAATVTLNYQGNPMSCSYVVCPDVPSSLSQTIKLVMDEALYGGSLAGQTLTFEGIGDAWAGGAPPAGLVSLEFNLFGFPPVAFGSGSVTLDAAYNVVSAGFDIADGPPDGLVGGSDSWFAGTSLWQTDDPGTWTTTLDGTPVSAVPVPGAIGGMLIAVAGLVSLRRRAARR